MRAELTTTTGLASISAWDQTHAEAIDRLRQCRAFVLVTVEENDAITMHAGSRDLAPEGMAILLAVGAESMLEAAQELI